MKKVCHMTSVHPPFDVRIFHKECKTLIKYGYEVTLIAQHDSDRFVDGVKIRALPRVKDRRRRMLQLPRLALRLALDEDADVYHFHDPELIPVGLALKKHGKKVIYDVHEDVPRQILDKPYLSKSTATFISSVFEKFENSAAKKFDFVITPRENVRERLVSMHANVVVVNNYPVLEEMPELPSWDNRANDVAYIGAISKERGILEMIEAIGMVDSTLHLAGIFEQETLREAAERLPGWKKVVYYGYADRELVKKILGRVRIGLATLHPIPNYVYERPTKLFEYMAAGIPVISSDFPLCREVVEQNHCGICVDPLNPVEIADAIKYLLSHPDESSQMGQNGRHAVMNKYNWEIESQKLLNIYGELCSQV